MARDTSQSNPRINLPATSPGCRHAHKRVLLHRDHNRLLSRFFDNQQCRVGCGVRSRIIIRCGARIVRSGCGSDKSSSCRGSWTPISARSWNRRFRMRFIRLTVAACFDPIGDIMTRSPPMSSTRSIFAEDAGGKQLMIFGHRESPAEGGRRRLSPITPIRWARPRRDDTISSWRCPSSIPSCYPPVLVPALLNPTCPDSTILLGRSQWF